MIMLHYTYTVAPKLYASYQGPRARVFVFWHPSVFFLPARVF